MVALARITRRFTMPDLSRQSLARIGRRGGLDGAEGPSAAVARQGRMLRTQAALLARREHALGRAGAGLWECRLRDEALDWTGGVYDLFEIPRGSALHRAKILDLYAPSSLRLLSAIRGRAIAGCGGFRLDAEIVTMRGRRRWIRITASVEAEGGRPARLFGMKQDVTEEIVRLAESNRRADHDPMTGLANRRAFEARFLRADRSAPVGALLLVDLDGFKRINDNHGHAAGDLCIRRSAARLAQVARDAELVARIGGDEFAIVLPAQADPRGLVDLGRRIVEALGRPIAHQGRSLGIGACVGIVPGGIGTPTAAFERADAALYAAKAVGGNTVRIADAESAASGRASTAGAA